MRCDQISRVPAPEALACDADRKRPCLARCGRLRRSLATPTIRGRAAEASLAMPLEGHAGFAGVAVSGTRCGRLKRGWVSELWPRPYGLGIEEMTHAATDAIAMQSP